MYNENDIKKILGATIKELRKEKSLTQEKFAEIVGIDPNGLAQIESGRNFVSADVMSRLSNGLGVSPAVLFTPRPKYFKNPDVDYKKELTRLLPALTEEQLHELYNIALVMKK